VLPPLFRSRKTIMCTKTPINCRSYCVMTVQVDGLNNNWTACSNTFNRFQKHLTSSTQITYVSHDMKTQPICMQCLILSLQQVRIWSQVWDMCSAANGTNQPKVHPLTLGTGHVVLYPSTDLCVVKVSQTLSANGVNQWLNFSLIPAIQSQVKTTWSSPRW